MMIENSETSTRRANGASRSQGDRSAKSGYAGASTIDHEGLPMSQSVGIQSLDNCLYRTCLRPNVSLKNQMFMSFGLVTTVSLIFVLVASIIIAKQASNKVTDISRENLERLSEQKLMASSRIFAETMSKTLQHLYGVPGILTETTKDRFVGYPDHPGYDNDNLVPFKDQISGRNIYPLNASTLIPSEWEMTTVNISRQNDLEHLVYRERSSFYDLTSISTASASYRMQGSCDPFDTNSSSGRYYPECTDANNNITTGGVVQPTSTAEMIHKKASDYASVVLKPLFESHEHVRNVGFYFSNSGAGLEITYPGRVADGTTSYTSIGCEWMRSPNPFNTAKQIGTEEEIARCHPKGIEVFNREYNPLEREWCRDQALYPNKAQVYGPYLDAFSHNEWLLSFGQAVYDRITGYFIACTLMDITVDEIARLLNQFRITDASDVAFTRWDEEGTVIAYDPWTAVLSDRAITVSELSMGVSTEIFSEMKDRFKLAYDDSYNALSYDPVVIKGEKAFACYPVPVPPTEYDPFYTPTFAIILGVDSADIYQAVNELDGAVNQHVWSIIRAVLIAGFVGLIVVIICIYMVSIYLTMPMSWMSAVGEKIVQSVGSLDKEINFDHATFLRYSPKTEISSLVWQFQKAVKSFSGVGTARLHTYKGIEVQNPFHLHDNFNILYTERESQQFAFVYGKSIGERSQHDNDNQVMVGSSSRINWGPNFRTLDGESATTLSSSCRTQDIDNERGNNPFTSSLFWWILATITVPLLITMIAISTFVTIQISEVLPHLALDVEESYINFEKTSLYPLAKARADFASKTLAPFVRDMHLLSRVAGWLFLNGIERSDSITEMKTAVEECKNYSDPLSNPCPYSLNRSNTICDCAWNQIPFPSFRTCLNYGYDTRFLQKQAWFGSRLDALPNGDVNSSKSFPEFASTPGTTSWWSGIEEVPGYELGFNATGSGTTYEDLLKLSALSIVQIPVFNYKTKIASIEDITISGPSYVAIADNGIYESFGGCDVAYAYPAAVVSDMENLASVINPQLCPLGKYGYDPRCRPWYYGGLLTNNANGAPLFVTPPYNFQSVVDNIGLTAVLPIRDKASSTYIGNINMDINFLEIVKALTQTDTPLNGDGIHVLIPIMQNQFFGADVVVAPGFDLEMTPLDGGSFALAQFILPHDDCENSVGSGCDNLAMFDVILQDMKAGNSGSVEFTRTTVSGDSEVVYWSYYPVTLFSGDPIDNTDFSRGISKYDSPMFSLALAATDEGLRRAFDPVRDDLERDVQIATGVLVFLISFAFLCVGVVSALVAVSVIQPVSRLLKVVTRIGRQDVNDDIPDMYGGCREVTMVQATFERLYLVVRFGNAAFFSGDLSVAYNTLQGALDLFTKLSNEKAIGIANNNLGNTMLIMYRTMKKTQTPKICRLSRTQVLANGTKYFKNAIDSGEDALARINKEEGWSTNYLVFMQQLSNRYFNRAMLLLTSKEDQPDPEEAERQGLMDLATARDMDREVVDNGDTYGFKGDSTVHFELLLGRIKGVMYLIEHGYSDEWDVEELFEDARKVLVGVLEEPSHETIRSTEPVAQMQMLDAVLIEYYLFVEKIEQAAKVAIRMLVEDEYVIGEAMIWAIKALVQYTQDCTDQDLGGEDPSDIRSKLFQYRNSVAETLSLLSSTNPGKGGEWIVMRECAKQSAYGDVSMELF